MRLLRSEPLRPGAAADPLAEPLLTASQVAALLAVRPKRVYELPIPRVQLSPNRVRWRPAAVRAFLATREHQ